MCFISLYLQKWPSEVGADLNTERKSNITKATHPVYGQATVETLSPFD